MSFSVTRMIQGLYWDNRRYVGEGASSWADDIDEVVAEICGPRPSSLEITTPPVTQDLTDKTIQENGRASSSKIITPPLPIDYSPASSKYTPFT